MLRRKLAESLTVRIFLLTFLLLLGAGGLTFALIAWATPITYTAVISDRLQAQVADLTQQLAQTNLADAGPILDAFVRESGAEVALTAPGGAEADTGSLLVLPEEDWQVAVTMSGADNSVQTYEADTYQVQIDRADGVVTATQTGILTTQITFADQEGTYQLLVSPQLRLANQAVEALGRVAPWLALALLAFSLLCAFGYSRYITRPIVRLNGIAGRMAELDLQWVCGERRRDEIGQLGRSLDKMARRLSAALTDLETANQATGPHKGGNASHGDGHDHHVPHARQDDSGGHGQLHPKQRLCPRTAHAPGCLQNIRVQCGESHVGVVHHGHDAVNRQGNNGSLVADPAEGDQDAQQGDGGNGVQHVADAHHRRRDTGMLRDPDACQKTDHAGHGDGGQSQADVGQQQSREPVCPLGVQAQNPLQQFHEPLTGAGGALRLPDRPPRSGRTGGSAPS